MNIETKVYMLGQGNLSTITFGGEGSEMVPSATTLVGMIGAIEAGYFTYGPSDDMAEGRISLARTEKKFDIREALGSADPFDFMEEHGKNKLYRKKDDDEGSFMLSDLEDALNAVPSAAPKV